MHNHDKTWSAVLFGTALLFLQACAEEGPAERAGARLDEAAREAGEEIDEAARTVGERLEDACEEVRDRPC